MFSEQEGFGSVPAQAFPCGVVMPLFLHLLQYPDFCFSYIYQSLCPHYKGSKAKNSLVMHQPGEHFCWRPFFLSADLRFIVFVLEKKERTAVSLHIQCVCARLCVRCSGFHTVCSVVAFSDKKIRLFKNMKKHYSRGKQAKIVKCVHLESVLLHVHLLIRLKDKPLQRSNRPLHKRWWICILSPLCHRREWVLLWVFLCPSATNAVLNLHRCNITDDKWLWDVSALSKMSFLFVCYMASWSSVLQDSAQEAVITRDIHRTFPAHDYFKDSDGEGQDSLYKICKVMSENTHTHTVVPIEPRLLFFDRFIPPSEYILLFFDIHLIAVAYCSLKVIRF